MNKIKCRGRPQQSSAHKKSNAEDAETFQKLNIPVFGMVDTNSDPSGIDFPIPANDDAFKSIALILKHVGTVIEEGLSERKKDKEEADLKKEEESKKKVDAKEATSDATEAVEK